MHPRKSARKVKTLPTPQQAAKHPEIIDSDHALILANVGSEGDPVRVISWNMLGASGSSGYGDQPSLHEDVPYELALRDVGQNINQVNEEWISQQQLSQNTPCLIRGVNDKGEVQYKIWRFGYDHKNKNSSWCLDDINASELQIPSLWKEKWDQENVTVPAKGKIRAALDHNSSTTRKERFRSMLKNLDRCAKEHNVGVIHLQETDTKLILELLQEDPNLLDGWSIPPPRKIKKSGTTDYILTLYNSRIYEVLDPPKYALGNTIQSVRVLSCTLRNRKTKEVIDSHNVWGVFAKRFRDHLHLHWALDTMLRCAPDDRRTFALGDMNSRFARMDDAVTNCATNLVPLTDFAYKPMGINLKEQKLKQQKSRVNIQVEDCADGGFRRDKKGYIHQISTAILNPNTATVVIDDRSKEDVDPHPRKSMVLALDKEYMQEWSSLAQLLNGETSEGVDYFVLSNSFNEKENYLLLDEKHYQRFEKLVRIAEKTETPQKAMCGLILLSCDDSKLPSNSRDDSIQREHLIEKYTTEASLSSSPIIIKQRGHYYIYGSDVLDNGEWGDVQIPQNTEDYATLSNLFESCQKEVREKDDHTITHLSADDDRINNPALINIVGPFHTPFHNFTQRMSQCEIFFRSQPDDGIYQESNHENLYLYKGNNGKIFYDFEGKDKQKERYELDLEALKTVPDSEFKSKENSKKYNQANYGMVVNAIFAVTSKRGHTAVSYDVKIPRRTFRDVIMPKARELNEKAAERREKDLQRKRKEIGPLKGLLIGVGVGLLAVGLIAATVATCGAAGIIAGGAVGALAALAVAGGSTLTAGMIAGGIVAACAAAGALVGLATDPKSEVPKYHEYVDKVMEEEELQELGEDMPKLGKFRSSLSTSANLRQVQTEMFNKSEERSGLARNRRKDIEQQDTVFDDILSETNVTRSRKTSRRSSIFVDNNNQHQSIPINSLPNTTNTTNLRNSSSE